MACLRLTRISGELAWRCAAEIDYGKRGGAGECGYRKAHHKHPRAFFESLVNRPRIQVETELEGLGPEFRIAVCLITNLTDISNRLVIGIGVTRCYSQSNSGRVLLGVDTRNYLTANLREFPPIAFFLRRRALLRLIAYAGIARRLEKCCRKNPRAGFSFKGKSYIFE